jgi:hypothetical protein
MPAKSYHYKGFTFCVTGAPPGPTCRIGDGAGSDDFGQTRGAVDGRGARLARRL